MYATAVTLVVMLSFIGYLLSVVQGHWRWMVGLFSHGTSASV